MSYLLSALLLAESKISNARAPVLAHFGAAITGLGKLPFYCH